MQFTITHFTTLQQVQDAFHKRFPLLKLEFFIDINHDGKNTANERITDHTLTFGSLTQKTGSLEIHGNDTVAQVEEKFINTFAVIAQVFHKRGENWLISTTSDKLTLDELNIRAQDASAPLQGEAPIDAVDRLELE
jgi:hypothetical protein